MTSSSVSQIPAASPEAARAHFANRLALETDCADVHEAMSGAGGAAPPISFSSTCAVRKPTSARTCRGRSTCRTGRSRPNG